MTWRTWAVALLGASALAGPLATVPVELHRGLLFAEVSATGRPFRPAIDSAEVPFELHKGMIFARVSVNGGPPLAMALDSDSPRTALDLAKARELGIDVNKVALSRGTHAETPVEIRVAENVRIRIGGVEIAEPLIVSYPLAFLAKRLERPIDGIVGSNVLRRYVLEVDFAGRRMRFHDPESFVAPKDARAISAAWAGEHIVVKGAAEDVEGSFYVDTGVGGSAAVLYRKCSGDPRIASALRESRELVATAFGGDRAERAGRIDRLRIGDVTIENAPVRLSEVNADVCGHVGNAFFEQFRVYFDLPHGRLLLAKE